MFLTNIGNFFKLLQKGRYTFLIQSFTHHTFNENLSCVWQYVLSLQRCPDTVATLKVFQIKLKIQMTKPIVTAISIHACRR